MYKPCGFGLSELFLQKISKELNPDEWKPLGRLLKLKENALQCIEYDHGKNSVQEICFRMLLQWQQTFGLNATKQALVDALEEINRNDIIQKVCSDSEECEISVETTENITKVQQILKRLNEEPYKTILQELQLSITEDFTHIELPRASWLQEKILPLEQLFVDLTMNMTDLYGMMKEEDTIKMEEMFDKHNGKIPKRILIEGDPGYGKTTLICKLASDWANGKSYIRDKFNLIFVVVLRYFEGNLEDTIMKHCSVEGYQREQILETIGCCGEKLLFILDGFDEIKDCHKMSIEPLLKGKQYSSATVLMTSRKGETFLQEAEGTTQNKTKGVSMLLGVKPIAYVSLWDKRIQIQGISKERREEFLLRYFHADKKEKFARLSSLITRELKTFGECPLFLILLAILIEENQVQTFTTRTSLYKQIFNFITRRALLKQHLISNEDINIFSENRENHPFFVNLLLQFGKMALTKLKQGLVSFHKHELEICSTKCSILSLGFLTQNLVFYDHKLHETFDPLHKSFLEFLAAFSLTYVDFNLQSNIINFYCEVSDLIKESFIHKINSMFYPFLVGLLEDKAHLFFSALSPFSAFFPATGRMLRNVYPEMKSTEQNIESLLPFVPPIWNVEHQTFFKSDLHCSLLQLASENKIIHTLNWNLEYSMNIPQCLCVESLCLWIENVSEESYRTLETKAIKCNELTWVFEFLHEDWNSIVQRLGSIDCTKMNFVISATNKDETLNLIYDEVTRGRWRKKIINHVSIDIIGKKSQNFFSKIKSLVGQNRITNKISLYLYMISNETGFFRRQSFIQSLINSITESSILKNIIIFSDKAEKPISIDISRLYCSHKNGRECICLNDGIVWKNFNSQQPLILDILMLASNRSGYINDDIDVMFLCKTLKKLSLSTDHCRKMNRNFTAKWESVQTITEVTLFFTDSFTIEDLEWLEKIVHLKELTINIHNITLTPSQMKDTAFFLKRLSLKSLRIHISETNLPFFKQLLKIFSKDSDNISKTIIDEATDNLEEDIKFCLESLIIKFYCNVSKSSEELLKNLTIFEELFLVKEMVLTNRIINLFYTFSPKTLNKALLDACKCNENFKYKLVLNPIKDDVLSIIEHCSMDEYILVRKS